MNLDTNTAIAFIAEGSTVRHHLKALVQGQPMRLTETARDELLLIISRSAGPLEQARAQRFLGRVIIIPDNPSLRALRLTPTRNLGINDIRILGTGDRLGIPTLTGDQKAVRAARAQGVDFAVVLHLPFPLRGL